MPNVTMYSTSWCGFCHRARRFLDANDVTYTEIDIEDNQDAALQVEQWNRGNRTVPKSGFSRATTPRHRERQTA